MSRIYFHTDEKTVEVYGWERVWLSQLCSRIACGVFDMLSASEKLALLPESFADPSRLEQFGRNLKIDQLFKLYIGAHGGENFTDGHEVFATVLNTLIEIGSPELRLAAYIHGQCEIHGFIEHHDLGSFAEVLEGGMRKGIFREKVGDTPCGWRDVIDLCRRLAGKQARKAVVMSYSVSGGFPVAGHVFHWLGDEEQQVIEEQWERIAPTEQFALALDALRSYEIPPRWHPHKDCLFGHGRSAFTYLGENK